MTFSDYEKTQEISQSFAAKAIEPPTLLDMPSDAPATMRQFTVLAMQCNTHGAELASHEFTIGRLVDTQRDHAKRLAVLVDKDYGMRAQVRLEIEQQLGALHKRINVYAGICLGLVAYIAWLK